MSYSTFLGKVGSGQVKTVDINDKGAIKDGTKFTTRMPTALDNSRLEQRLESKKAEITASQSRGGSPWGTLLVLFLPLLFIVALFVWSGRRAARTLGRGLSAIGRARAKIIEAERPTTRFEDVAGYEGVKQEISEIVDFLRSPERYAVVGAKGPRGVIMVGPPGTGKTLIARAVAGEAEVPFLSATGSAFVEMFVGVGASRVRVNEAAINATLGPIGYSSGAPHHLGGESTEDTLWRPYSEQTQRIVDEETARLVGQAEERAVDLLRDHRAALDTLADLLTARETIDGSVVLDVLQQQQGPDGHHPAATGKPTPSP
ncbi:Peptidase family M41 [Streptomyces mirabilis]|uniref:Peptidase family M41 n=1 Tax=Streptomyces mirabilis TaxID=68239 RepID=A0A1I2XEL1_9ACTN|nr:Peptidase family M41 [Streptomyces mirabilis]